MSLRQHLLALSPAVLSATSETARPPWNEAPGHLRVSFPSSPADAWVASLSPQGSPLPRPSSSPWPSLLQGGAPMPHPPGPALGRLLSLVRAPGYPFLMGPLALIPYWELEFARGDLWFRPQQASYGHSRPLCPQGWEGKPGEPGYSDQRRSPGSGAVWPTGKLGSSKP